MKNVLPREHGAWAMLILPFFTGMLAGGWNRWHLPLFAGWLALFLFSNVALQAVKRMKERRFYLKWALIYGTAALLFLSGPVLREPRLLWFGALLLPVFFINAYYAKRRMERRLLNDFFAVSGLSAGGWIAYVAGAGRWDETAWWIGGFYILFFMGSVFFVKTLIREKNNRSFRWASWGYHALVVAFVLMIDLAGAALAFVPSFLRAVLFYGRPLRPKQTGMIETVNSLVFAGCLLILFL